MDMKAANIRDYRKFVRRIKEDIELFYIIHYSCQNLNDDNEELTPRITSISIIHYSTQETFSFSTHIVAEKLQIKRTNINENYDDIERQLLCEFYQFTRRHRSKYWIHWNMRNAMYGFEHIEHRYAKLTGRHRNMIPAGNRINLNDIIEDRFGKNYAGHPKMRSLMEMNSGIHPNFLTGCEEVEAFEQGKYFELHQSTLCKVGFFRDVILQMLDKKLLTSSNSQSWGWISVKRHLERLLHILASSLTIFGFFR